MYRAQNRNLQGFFQFAFACALSSIGKTYTEDKSREDSVNASSLTPTSLSGQLLGRLRSEARWKPIFAIRCFYAALSTVSRLSLNISVSRERNKCPHCIFQSQPSALTRSGVSTVSFRRLPLSRCGDPEPSTSLDRLLCTCVGA